MNHRQVIRDIHIPYKNIINLDVPISIEAYKEIKNNIAFTFKTFVIKPSLYELIKLLSVLSFRFSLFLVTFFVKKNEQKPK
tara:strand:- start:376 stop:618 length:243 start_codon:yes stop_codon:yes gene_type:complete